MRKPAGSAAGAAPSPTAAARLTAHERRRWLVESPGQLPPSFPQGSFLCALGLAAAQLRVPFGDALRHLVAYAEQNDLAYEYEYTPAFAKWQRLLSPEQYKIVEARTSRGVSRVMLFSKATIQAEWEANAPLRESMAIKRERLRVLRAKRAAKQRST